jgi:GxxExxY protein
LRENTFPMIENEVAKHIVDVAYKIHSTYGPGLLESVYEAIMAHELSKPISKLHGNNQFH